MDGTFAILLVVAVLLASWRFAFVAFVLGGVVSYISMLMIVHDLANRDDPMFGGGIAFGITGLSCSLVLVSIALAGRAVRQRRAERERLPHARVI